MDMRQSAIDLYVQSLVEIAAMLATYREARSEFDPSFLVRVMRDGFLQAGTEHEKRRIMEAHKSGEEFLLWRGVARQKKMNWNCIGWIFPFYTTEEMERSYERIIRAELSQKSWPRLRQLVFSCRLKFQEAPIKMPTNLVKVRATGDACRTAMRTLEQLPPNLRYVTKAVIAQLPSSHYLRKRIQMKVIIGEKLEPFIVVRR